MSFDLVIHNGLIVTASDILPRSIHIGINNGIIETITTSKISGKQEIDAEGGYIMPGGVDSHVHIDQDNAPAGDDFETGSRSAIAGGTTTMIPFAIQPKKEYDLLKVVEEYHGRANKKGGSYCDYGFHLIISEPTEEMLEKSFPEVCEKEAITSVKVYTTYPRYKLTDAQLLQILLTNRKNNVTTMVHAENSDIIDFINNRLKEKNLSAPFYHTVSRPQIAEDEASYRAISLAKLIDVPMLLVHMSCESALDHVKKAQTDLFPIFAETCPQYLFLTGDKLNHDCSNHGSHDDEFQGAKFICSPPLRSTHKDLEGVWKHLINGTITVFSSDHAPSKYDHPLGKKKGLINGIPHFTEVPNGLPGIETRLPLLFCYGVETGRITPQKFVELTSTNPAKLYGLNETKGSIAVGLDADFTIWYPPNKIAKFSLTNEMLHHSIDYTPFEGMEFTNWPRYTILRGNVCYDRDNGGVVSGKIGTYLRRKGSALAGPMKPLNHIFE
jgi:dihydropyrimidinase